MMILSTYHPYADNPPLWSAWCPMFHVGMRATGKTRDEAVEKVRAMLIEHLAGCSAEAIEVDI